MKNIAVGIDIGTYKVKVVVAEQSERGSFPRILGVGQAESKGLRHGYIMYPNDATKSVRQAILQAEKATKIKINKVFLSVGGIGLSSISTVGSVMISRADSEITQLDLDNAIEESQNQIPSTFIQNRRIIHSIPTYFRIDGKPILGKNPVGMKGVKLEVKVLFITSLEHHLQELVQAVEEAGVEIIDVMAAPLAASLVTLSKAEKVAGCILANIGSETVSIVVYEDDIPTSLEIFQIGSNDITNDIALGFKVSLEEAEKIKKEHNSDRDRDRNTSKKKLDEIVSARLSDIFELIEAHLKKIDRSGLLPAGIILTGGGSGITTIEDLAKAYLKLPTKTTGLACDIDKVECFDKNVRIKDSNWAVAYGLTIFGLQADDNPVMISNITRGLVKRIKASIVKLFKQFLP